MVLEPTNPNEDSRPSTPKVSFYVFQVITFMVFSVYKRKKIQSKSIRSFWNLIPSKRVSPCTGMLYILSVFGQKYIHFSAVVGFFPKSSFENIQKIYHSWIILIHPSSKHKCLIKIVQKNIHAFLHAFHHVPAINSFVSSSVISSYMSHDSTEKGNASAINLEKFLWVSYWIIMVLKAWKVLKLCELISCYNSKSG